ncbi:aspartyl-phosphate phosphatase Spo0E family protein [Clostridium saccharoperbutylacetonicum]|uniref:aspartyl-phosphate phosphatase Spo0E family protein n=1 Tax=Clostridium saccharoperbutylacetonicum TaxID=36745 RepID=UPI0039EADD52
MKKVESKEILQEKLYKSISNYGRTDKRTVKLSQSLDAIIAAEQRALMGINKVRY